MSNFRLLDETTISASTSNVSVTDVFSSDYNIYKIVTNNFSTAGTDACNLNGRFIDSYGTVITASNYDYAYYILKPETTFQQYKNTDQAKLVNLFAVTDQSPESASSVTWVFHPFSSSLYTYVLNQSTRVGSGGQYRMHKYIGGLKQTVSMSGFNMYEDETRPFNSGTIRTYGLRVDS